MSTIFSDKKLLDKWGETRKIGKWRYILFYGVLLGAAGFLLGKIGLDFFFYKEFKNMTEYIFTSLLFGVLFGVSTWIYTENRYKKYIEQIRKM